MPVVLAHVLDFTYVLRLIYEGGLIGQAEWPRFFLEPLPHYTLLVHFRSGLNGVPIFY